MGKVRKIICIVLLLGAQSYYEWQTDYDTHELMSAETYLYEDIPIDLTGCVVNGADSLT
ncbi:MAG: hypothetical protein ACI4J5_02255 [Oscillospiraceae bacterium]